MCVIDWSSSVATLAQALFGAYQSHFRLLAPMKQASLLAFAVVGKQVEETREARQERQRAREERKKVALELLGLPWPEHTCKGAGRPPFEDQYKAALYQAVRSDAPYFDRLSREMPGGLGSPWCRRSSC